jgi:heme exporter protein D
MSWGGWSGFWAMGGYGLYVWGAYAVTFGALALEILSLVKRSHETKA